MSGPEDFSPALQLPINTCPGEVSKAELTIKKLLFNIVVVSESPVLILASGVLSSKSMEELGFILRPRVSILSHRRTSLTRLIKNEPESWGLTDADSPR